MASFLRKYATGSGADITIPIIKAGVDDFAVSADWTPASGDVKVSKDGGASANIATLPTFITDIGWKFVFSNAELTCARLNINIVDSATKAIKDQHLIIDTYGNASAQHAFDFDNEINASSGIVESNLKQINGASVSGNAATLTLKQLDIQNSAGAAIVAKSTGGNGHGLYIAGNGSGHGAFVEAGSSGNGLHISTPCAGTGRGLVVIAEGDDAVSFESWGGNGQALNLSGNGSGNGLKSVGGATGDGAEFIGGSTSGNGVTAVASGSNFGHGIEATGVGASAGMDINGGPSGWGMDVSGGAGDISADITGNITGNLSGSVGSVTAAVTVGTNNDKTGYSISGSITTLDGLNNLSAAAVNAEVDTALSDIGLDHLISSAAIGADITDDSIIAQMVSKSATADWDTFDNTTDALEAIRDRGDAAWTSAIVGTVDANVIQINGQATNGNNATLNLKQLNIVNSAGTALIAKSTGGDGIGFRIAGAGNGSGLSISADGSTAANGITVSGGEAGGKGIVVTSSSTALHLEAIESGHAIAAKGAAIGGANAAVLFENQDSGPGFEVKSGEGGGDGMKATSRSGGHGINATGHGSGRGGNFQGGTNGDGLRGTSGTGSGNGATFLSTVSDPCNGGHGIRAYGVGNGHGLWAHADASGDGIHAESIGTGDGMHLVGAGGGYDLNADIQGSLSGSVGSVVGNVGGNVVGTVASVAGNVGGNVVGSVGSVIAGVIVTTNNDKTGYSISGTKQTLDALNDLSGAEVQLEAEDAIDAKFTFTGGNVDANAKAISDSTAAADSVEANIGNLDVAVSTRSTFDRTSEGVIVTTNNDKTGYSISGAITTLDGLENISQAQVTTIVETGLATTLRPEKSIGAPADTDSIAGMLTRVYGAQCFEGNQSGGEPGWKTFFNSSNVAIWKKEVSDDGTTYEEKRGVSA